MVLEQQHRAIKLQSPPVPPSLQWPSSLIIYHQHHSHKTYIIQSSAGITRSNIVRYYMNNYRNWGRIPMRSWIQKDTPYLALTGELCGVFCECLWENGPRYNGTTLLFSIKSFTKCVGCYILFELLFYVFSSDDNPPTFPECHPSQEQYSSQFYCMCVSKRSMNTVYYQKQYRFCIVLEDTCVENLWSVPHISTKS